MKSLNIIDATVITRRPGFRYTNSYQRDSYYDYSYPRTTWESERILGVKENTSSYNWKGGTFGNPVWDIIYLRKKIVIIHKKLKIE